ncbi:MAG TPA: hypothetical protein VFA12_02170 [Stellaceae bacterium]|nr:hypothetical protein [Stellaceae bacterium]
MYAVVGPVQIKADGYAFDVWTPEAGLRPGFPYPLVQHAHYARRAEIRQTGSRAMVCNTVEEFASEIAAVSHGGHA